MQFTKTFDEIREQILVDCDGQGIDRSKAMTQAWASCLASTSWGVRQHQQWIWKNILPDQGDDESILGWARQFNITVNPEDKITDVRNAVLRRFRNPFYGSGTAYDYEAWAEEVVGVKKNAKCVDNEEANGLGSIDVIISATGNNEVADNTLLAAVNAHVLSRRPAGRGPLRIRPITLRSVDVTMTVSGTGIDHEILEGVIRAYLSAFVPRQPLYLSQLVALVSVAGVTNAVVTAPIADIVPDNTRASTNETIRPGSGVHVYIA